MKYLALILLLIGCIEKHDPNPTITPYEQAEQRANFYQDEIKNPYQLFDRCDGLTFIGLWDWSVRSGKRVDIYKHEYPKGKWHRDVEPCYDNDLDGNGESDSRSEISTESYLGAMRGMKIREDLHKIEDAIDYAEDHNYVLGEGPLEYTFLIHLMPLLYQIEDPENLILIGIMHNSEETQIDPWEKITGYRGNVIANYIDLKGKALGYINDYELKMVKKLRDKVPTNPIYHALYDCYREVGWYNKGIQNELMKVFLTTSFLPIIGEKALFMQGRNFFGFLNQAF